MKTCLSCRETKPISEYHKNSGYKDGVVSRCKPCVNKADRQKRSASVELRRTLKANRTEKRCPKCGEVKMLEHFSFHNKPRNIRNPRCKDCASLHSKRFSAPRKRNKVIKLKSVLVSFAGGVCADCGLLPSNEWPLACFDFHHIGKKSFSISGWLQSTKLNYPDNEVIDEVKNCELLCSNCHRRRHAASFIASE